MPRVVPPVLALAHPSPGVREAAAAALAAAASAETARATAHLIGHAEIAVRALAADVLVRLGDDAVDALAPALSDPAPEVRALALATLARLPAQRLADAVAARLDDPDANVRLAAVDALGALGAAPFAGRLVALYGAEPLSRASVVAALGPTGTAEATALVGTALSDADPVVRCAAAEALAALGADALPLLTRALSTVHGPARAVLLDALVRWSESHGHRADVSGLEGDLLAMLGDPEPAYRLSAARGLRHLADRVHPAALLAHAGTDDDLDAALFDVLAALPDPFGALVEAGAALPDAAGAAFALALVSAGRVPADRLPDAGRFVEARFGSLGADTKVEVLALCAASGRGALAGVLRRGLDDPDPTVAAVARDLSLPSALRPTP